MSWGASSRGNLAGYHVNGVGLSERDDKFGENQLVGLLR